MRKLICLFLFAVVVLAHGAGGVSSRPNIILILVDDQGWNSLSCPMDHDVPGSKSDFYQTPNIDQLASEGMRFSWGYSAAPICSPSRHSIQFGVSPAKMRVTNNKAPNKQHCDPQNALPNLIKQADPRYAAAHFGKWHVLVEPEACGYDESDGMTDNYEGSHGGKTDDPKRTYEVTDRAVSFMERKAGAKQPFFLQVSYYADHKLFLSSPAMQAKYEALSPGERHTDPVFAGMNEDLDQGVGRILDAVDRLGIADDTYIVYTADNGYDEDRPTMSTPPRRKAWPLGYSKGWLYEGGVRVPFIVRGPGVKPNTFSKVPVLGYDLMPTFLELIKPGFKLPDVVEGGSLLPLLEHGGVGEVKRANGFIQFQAVGGWLWDMGSFIVGRDKLVYTFEGKIRRLELFDLGSDISEQNDLSNKFPEKTQRLNKQMLDYLKSVDAFMPSDEPPKISRKPVVKKTKNVKKKTQGNYLTLQAPKQVVAGTTANVIITHKIPPKLGEQQIHVAVKSGKGRIKEHEFTVKGSGTLEVSFDIPKQYSGKIIRFNAYLGETYQESLQFRSEPVLLE